MVTWKYRGEHRRITVTGERPQNEPKCFPRGCAAPSARAPGNKGKLREKLFQITHAEARLWLFGQMLDRGLVTRDVQSFVQNQAYHRREIKQNDTATGKVAMRAKYEDTKKHLNTLQEELSHIRKDLLTDLNNKKYRLKKITKSLREDPK